MSMNIGQNDNTIKELDEHAEGEKDPVLTIDLNEARIKGNLAEIQ